jgi:hypothetical protein
MRIADVAMSGTPLTSHTVVVRSSEPLSAAVSDSLVLFSIARGKYIALDAVSTAIWQRLERPTSMKELCESLGKEFDVDPVVCERDVRQLITQLVSRGLVDVIANQDSA